MANEESFFDRHNKHLLTKKRHFIYRLIAIIVLWSSFIIYFILPISKVNDVKINGNVFLLPKQVLSIADISEKNFRIDINDKDVERRLNKNPYIAKASSKINAFSSRISIIEIHPIGKSDNRILWSDGTFTTEPVDEKTYGYLPEIKATISASFLEDFANASSSWGNLRRSKNMLLIDEKDYPLSAKKTYSLYFKETINNQTINIIFVVDKASVTKKITLELYNQVINEFNPNNVVNDTLTVGYIDSSYSYWRI